MSVAVIVLVSLDAESNVARGHVTAQQPLQLLLLAMNFFSPEYTAADSMLTRNLACTTFSAPMLDEYASKKMSHDLT